MVTSLPNLFTDRPGQVFSFCTTNSLTKAPLLLKIWKPSLTTKSPSSRFVRSDNPWKVLPGLTCPTIRPSLVNILTTSSSLSPNTLCLENKNQTFQRGL